MSQRSNSVIAFLALGVAVVSFVIALSLLRHHQTGVTSNNAVFDRVTKSGELRVAYLVLPPYLDKDVKTGKISGIIPDVMEELAHRLELKLVWVEEADLSNLSAGLEAKRYDMLAYPLWRSASRARKVKFSVPLYYTLVKAYSAGGDNRFDFHLDRINRKDVQISVADGELAAAIAQEDYPNAKVNALPNISDYTQLLLEVATHKSDVTFFNTVVAEKFIRENPGKVREVQSTGPLRVFAETLILPIDDSAFEGMINSGLLELSDNGFIKRTFSAHGENPDDYYFPIKPYVEGAAGSTSRAPQ